MLCITELRRTSLHQCARFSLRRYTCSKCLLDPHYSPLRQLSSSPRLLRKGGGKQEQKRTVEINAAKTAGKDDAHDFSNYHQKIEKATNYLKRELSKLKAGGLDLDAIESLKVNLSVSGGGGGGGPKDDGSRSGAKGKGEIVHLGDVAQVVPRGRLVIIMVAEKNVRS